MTTDEKRKILNDFKEGKELDIQLYKSENFKTLTKNTNQNQLKV